MIQPRFATMFCFVQTDAEVGADTLDLLTGVCVKRSFDRISVDGQLSTSDTVFALANGASGVRVEPESADELRLGEALDALMRQLALEIVADGEGAAASGGSSSRAGPTPSSRSPARSPTRRSSRPPCTAATPTSAASCRRPAQAWPPGDPFVADLEIEGRQLVSAGDAIGLNAADLRELEQLVAGDEVEYALDDPRRGRRDRGLLLRPRPRLRPLQRGVHVMRDVATLLEALPYIRDFHGKTVVIKYGGAAMTDPELTEEFARDVVLLKYVGLNPVVVHGGGPDITRYMERLGMEVKFVDGLRVSDEATVEVAKMVLVGKQNKDIVLRINRHGQPAVGLCGDDGLLFTVAKQLAAGDTDIGFVGQIESRGRGRAAAHRRGLHPGGRVGRRRPRGQLLQRQRRRRRGSRRRGAGRLQGDLPDRRRGLARRPRRPGHAHLGGDRGRGARAAAAGQRRHAAQARGVRARAGVRRRQRPHRRRPAAALAAARAVHDEGIGTKLWP